MEICFSKEIYPKVALMKAAYFFTDKAYVHLDADDNSYIVTLEAKEGCQEVLEKEFMNEMLNQSIRHEVYLQTKDIRTLLMARAMASTVIEKPKDEQLLSGRENAEEILKDWFDNNAEIE